MLDKLETEEDNWLIYERGCSKTLSDTLFTFATLKRLKSDDELNCIHNEFYKPIADKNYSLLK